MSKCHRCKNDSGGNGIVVRVQLHLIKKFKVDD